MRVAVARFPSRSPGSHGPRRDRTSVAIICSEVVHIRPITVAYSHVTRRHSSDHRLNRTRTARASFAIHTKGLV